MQLPSRVQGPVTNGDVSESLDSESLESVLYHYSFSNMTPLDVQIIQRLVDRWHMAHYDLQWDIDQRSEVSGIAHLKFFFGVRPGLSPLDTLRSYPMPIEAPYPPRVQRRAAVVHRAL
jgi:hypothetical protein